MIPSSQQFWQRLVRLARSESGPLQPDAEIIVPVGFATRVVARAWADRSEPEFMSLIASRGWRALVAAFVVAGFVASVTYLPVSEAIDREVMAAEDPITALLEY